MNTIVLSGNLCKEVEIKTYNGKACVKNSIAVKRDFKNAKGEYDTDFFNFTIWGAQADFLGKYAKLGYKVLISGKLMNNEYEAEDGTKKYSNDIQVEHIEILSSKKETKEITKEEATSDKKSDEEEINIDDFLD